uniref:PHD-type domain-containing protein n=1 Tax=Branchiostoma floridae TaxID=7739 RepID=C3Z441_BRAFL|eukprot:XP_002596642.1 hypothetical protein BRAFLDRAFT_122048 [Branchiostoma floridae]
MAANDRKLACEESTSQLDSCGDAYTNRICGKCSRENDDDDSFIQCGGCKTWFHSHCSGLLENLLDDLVDCGEKDYICYTCLQLRNKGKRQKTTKQGKSQSLRVTKEKRETHNQYDLVNGTAKNGQETTNRRSGKLETVTQSASEKCKRNVPVGQSQGFHTENNVTSATFIRALTDRVVSLEAANTQLNERVARLELELSKMSTVCQVENGDAKTDFCYTNPTNASSTDFETETVQSECAIPTEYMFRDYQVQSLSHPDSLNENASAAVINENVEERNDDHVCAKQAPLKHSHPAAMVSHPKTSINHPDDDEEQAEILLIGDENIKGIQPLMLHKDLKLAKHSAQIIQDAALCLKNTHYTRLKCLILHIGMNDVRMTRSTDDVVHNYDVLISKAQKKYPSACIVLSLIPPWREISLMYKRKQVNDFLWDISTTIATAVCVDNENLGTERPILIKAGLYQSNGRLLNAYGTALLGSNLKKAVDAAIELGNKEAPQTVLHDDVIETDIKQQSGTLANRECVATTSQGSIQQHMSIEAQAIPRPSNKLSPGFVSYTDTGDGSFPWGHAVPNVVSSGPPTGPAHNLQHPTTYMMCPQPHPYPPLQPSPVQAITITQAPPVQQIPARQHVPMGRPSPQMVTPVHAVPIQPAVFTQGQTVQHQPTPMHQPTYGPPLHGRPMFAAHRQQSRPVKSMPMVHTTSIQHAPIGQAIPMQRPSPIPPTSHGQTAPMGQLLQMRQPTTMRHPTPMGQSPPIPQPRPMGQLLHVRQPLHLGQPLHVGQPTPIQPARQPVNAEWAMTGMHP